MVAGPKRSRRRYRTGDSSLDARIAELVGASGSSADSDRRTRKVTFLKESDAFALFPGGFGTMDEAFELLTLMQTGKSDLHPVVLLEAEGGHYWEEWRRFMGGNLGGPGPLSPEDLDLVYITDSIESAVGEIEGFYRNYHSQR